MPTTVMLRQNECGAASAHSFGHNTSGTTVLARQFRRYSFETVLFAHCFWLNASGATILAQNFWRNTFRHYTLVTTILAQNIRCNSYGAQQFWRNTFWHNTFAWLPSGGYSNSLQLYKLRQCQAYATCLNSWVV